MAGERTNPDLTGACIVWVRGDGVNGYVPWVCLSILASSALARSYVRFAGLAESY